MKYVKILGLLAAATAAMMAFAANASATTVTDSGGGTTPHIHIVTENGHTELHNSIVNIKCPSTFDAGVTAHGPTWVIFHVIIKFGICTDEWVVDVVSNGNLEVSYTGAGGHGVGTVRSTGATITATRAGLSCSYQTNNTTIGTVTGGNPATLKIEGNIPRHGGSFLCGGSTAAWTGSYVSTSTVKIDP